MPDKTHYVAEFMFDETLQNVALIRKLKPAWQKGKLNGIGGKVEEGEAPYDAMVREFWEETDCNTVVSQWNQLAQLKGPDWQVDFYATRGTLAALNSATDEKVEVHPVKKVVQWLDVIENLTWLIPLAIDHLTDGRPAIVEATYL